MSQGYIGAVKQIARRRYPEILRLADAQEWLDQRNWVLISQR
jgi:hypothetical protein